MLYDMRNALGGGGGEVMRERERCLPTQYVLNSFRLYAVHISIQKHWNIRLLLSGKQLC